MALIQSERVGKKLTSSNQAKAQENSQSEAKKGVWGRVPINSQEESRSEQESGEPTQARTCSHLHHH